MATPKIVKFRKNNKIKWRAKDEKGWFSYQGTVVKVLKGNITFTTKHGTMTVPLNDGKFTKL